MRSIVDINSINDISRVISELMKADKKSTALVMYDDHLVVMVYVSLVRQGFKISEDISIITLGDKY